DRRLVQYTNQRAGARVLAHDLPGGRTIWMDFDGGEILVVKAGSSQRPTRLISVSPSHGQMRVMDLAGGAEALAACRYGDVIVLIRSTDVRAYSLMDGRLLGQAVNPHRWLNGRFFRGTGHFYFVVWNGEQVRFEPVQMPKTMVFSNMFAIFDRP